MELQKIKIVNDSIWGYKCNCGAILFLEKEVRELVQEKDRFREELNEQFED